MLQVTPTTMYAILKNSFFPPNALVVESTSAFCPEKAETS